MLPSAGLALLALLRQIRSIGKTLKTFILRCLLYWPHVLRRLGRIWPRCLQTSPKDVPKKKGGQGGPSFTETSGGCEGYSTIHASRDSNRAGEPHFSLGPGSAEVLPLSPIAGQWQSAQSAPHSPASSASSSLPGSPRRFDRRLSRGSTSSIASSQNADSVRGTRPFTIRHLNTPLTLTHSRVTSTQFAGVPPTRPRSPSPIQIPLTVAFPSPSQSPLPNSSPSPSPHSHPLPALPLSSTPESSGSTQISNVIPQTISEGSHPSSFDIRVSPPSRSQTLELNNQSAFNSPRPPPFVQGHQSGPSRSPTPESDHSTQGPSDPRGLGSPYLASAHGTAPHGGGILPPGMPTPYSDQAQCGPSFPQSDISLSLVNLPIADTAGTLPDGRTRSIRLMTSEQVSRDVNKGDVPMDPSRYNLSPMEVNLPQYPRLCPQDWVPATHPGGALYFYNPKWRIFTDVYMYDSDLCAEILEFAAHLDRERTRLLGKINFPTNHYDLVLDIIKAEGDEIIWAYYYVDHNTRTLFWLHFYQCGDTLLNQVRGVRNASHVKLRIESLYWVHWSLYPTGPDWRRFPNDASNELLGNLLSSGIDTLTSKVSTSMYSATQIESMRGFIKEAEGLGPNNPHVITSVARLLSFYGHWKFLHFHGQKSSRQDRYRSIYEGSCRRRTILVKILSPMLFFFPDVHLLELEKLWTDKIIVEALWKEFMQKLVSEWTDFVLYSTVMLAANVAFLAIPGVIIAPQYPPPANQWIKPSPAQVISSISLMFSIGSIITGLLLIRRNRTMMTKDPRNAWNYLYGMHWPVVGLEPLAITFSLTYALLMWSAWGFFVALSIFSFQNTTRGIRIPVGIATAVVTMLIVWCIRNTWDPAEPEEEPIELPYAPVPAVEDSTQA